MVRRAQSEGYWDRRHVIFSRFQPQAVHSQVIAGLDERTAMEAVAIVRMRCGVAPRCGELLRGVELQCRVRRIPSRLGVQLLTEHGYGDEARRGVRPRLANTGLLSQAFLQSTIYQKRSDKSHAI